tara:strand:+ start:186 stop:392 length:207 start_codon:yes stop_codon:yes gene_type:complete
MISEKREETKKSRRVSKRSTKPGNRKSVFKKRYVNEFDINDHTEEDDENKYEYDCKCNYYIIIYDYEN